jgi:hypothetical protein
MAQPLVNGKQYAWANVSIRLLGRTLTGVTAVNYKEAQEVEGVYGAGNKMVGISYGNIANEGSITLQMEELQLLETIAPQGSILNIEPFDIVIVFQVSDTKIDTHVLQSCVFLENGRDMSQNDKSIEMEIPLFIGGISFKPTGVVQGG